MLLAKVWFAVLWVVVACALAGSFAVSFGEPGRLADGVAGVMEGEPVTWGWAYVHAALIGLPLAVAAATLFLPARTSAIVHLVLGVPLGAFGLFALVSEVAEGALHPHATLAAVGAGGGGSSSASASPCCAGCHTGKQRCIGSGRHKVSRRLASSSDQTRTARW